MKLWHLLLVVSFFLVSCTSAIESQVESVLMECLVEFGRLKKVDNEYVTLEETRVKDFKIKFDKTDSDMSPAERANGFTMKGSGRIYYIELTRNNPVWQDGSMGFAFSVQDGTLYTIIKGRGSPYTCGEVEVD